MTSQLPTISVIVPVYNGGPFLDRCLDALAHSTLKPVEVIVVDDCSTDDSANIGRTKGATVISTAQNSGPAVARNLAATTAIGDILLFVDADVAVKPDTIARVARRFQTNPEISALFGSYDDEPAEQNFLSQYKNLQHHYVHQISSPEASTFWSGLGAVRRKVFLEVRGFNDKKFGSPSIEDIELGFRLRSLGYKILLDREIQGKHLKRWGAVSHFRTEIMGRAVPWSKFILESDGLINDMNLKTTDRISAVLIALALACLPFVFLWPPLAVLPMSLSLVVALLNWGILSFFGSKKGVSFAIRAFPMLIAYYLYSGTTFVTCWFLHSLNTFVGRKRSDPDAV